MTPSPTSEPVSMKEETKWLLEILATEYSSPSYAFIEEFRGGTGWGRDSRADAIGMHLWPSRGLELIGFELKVTRSDWLHKLKEPTKAEEMKQFCDRWYLVVPNLKVIKYADELPEGWGLMFVENGKIRIMIEAPKLEPKPIDRLFLASLMRRVTKTL